MWYNIIFDYIKWAKERERERERERVWDQLLINLLKIYNIASIFRIKMLLLLLII